MVSELCGSLPKVKFIVHSEMSISDPLTNSLLNINYFSDLGQRYRPRKVDALASRRGYL